MPTLHASCVAIGARALLIRGPAGSGKSSLALEMMARGATLVADDQVLLTVDAGGLIADAPTATRGLIEARGIGLLTAMTAGPTPVAALVDLARQEQDRLPQARSIQMYGVTLPLLHNCASPYFAAGLVQYLKGDRREV